MSFLFLRALPFRPLVIEVEVDVARAPGVELARGANRREVIGRFAVVHHVGTAQPIECGDVDGCLIDARPFPVVRVGGQCHHHENGEDPDGK